MKKLLFYPALLVGVIFLSFSGCTSNAVRYSHEEISSYPPVIQERIKNNELSAGMTVQQVRYSWGAPSEINAISPSDEGKPREEWIYSKMMGISKTRLIFIDGKLAVIISADPGVVK